jgi:hypothetical protein
LYGRRFRDGVRVVCDGAVEMREGWWMASLRWDGCSVVVSLTGLTLCMRCDAGGLRDARDPCGRDRLKDGRQ